MKTLNDISSLSQGHTQVWFAKPSTRHLNDAFDPRRLVYTHVLLGSVLCSEPAKVYGAMQGLRSKGGRDLLKATGVTHGGMSTGDIMVIDGQAFQCCHKGFARL